MEMEMIEGQVQAEESGATAVAAGAADVLERLTHSVEALERVVERMQATRAAVSASESAERAATAETRRKTVPASVTNLLTKQGVSLEALAGEGMQAGAIDAALGSLSVEQRIAVKAQLLRAGVLG